MSSSLGEANLGMSTRSCGRTRGSMGTPHNSDAYSLPLTNDGEAKPTRAEILQKPWKYVGYDGYSRFIASDSDFFILRRFNNMNVRIALALQDDVSALEEELTALDKKYSMKNYEDVNNGTLRDDMKDRKAIVREIVKKLSTYNEFILQQAKLNQLEPAPERDIQSIRTWHGNHSYLAIAKEEQKYLACDDLICLVSRDKTPLRRLLDKSLTLSTLAMWRKKDIKPPDYDEKEISYYSDKRMDRFTSAVLLTVGVLMLITPIWILEALDEIRPKLAVITVYVFVFLLILSLAMYTKPFEALGATAAYAAVLMVFVQVGEQR